jgi:hypothetical protein
VNTRRRLAEYKLPKQVLEALLESNDSPEDNRTRIRELVENTANPLMAAIACSLNIWDCPEERELYRRIAAECQRDPGFRDQSLQYRAHLLPEPEV